MVEQLLTAWEDGALVLPEAGVLADDGAGVLGLREQPTRRALEELSIEGIATTTPLPRKMPDSGYTAAAVNPSSRSSLRCALVSPVLDATKRSAGTFDPPNTRSTNRRQLRRATSSRATAEEYW